MIQAILEAVPLRELLLYIVLSLDSMASFFLWRKTKKLSKSADSPVNIQGDLQAMKDYHDTMSKKIDEQIKKKE